MIFSVLLLSIEHVIKHHFQFKFLVGIPEIILYTPIPGPARKLMAISAKKPWLGQPSAGSGRAEPQLTRGLGPSWTRWSWVPAGLSTEHQGVPRAKSHLPPLSLSPCGSQLSSHWYPLSYNLVTLIVLL